MVKLSLLLGDLNILLFPSKTRTVKTGQLMQLGLKWKLGSLLLLLLIVRSSPLLSMCPSS